ncbi:HAD family hydrolase, partial [Micromonospora phytophila]|nr:HAD family hydrolase [Micromonospora phytophila]
MLPSPRALLWDFGGVLADAPPQPAAPPALVSRLSDVVDSAVPAEQIARDLAAGTRAYTRWRDDVGTGEHPVELSHGQVWADFVTHAWP